MKDNSEYKKMFHQSRIQQTTAEPISSHAVLGEVRSIVEKAWSDIVWKNDELDKNLKEYIEELHNILDEHFA